jgi:hypothetical protein
MNPEAITAWSAAVQASAGIVSLIVAGVLAVITYQYMKLTKGILAETSQARLAAQASASAAQQSASAANQSLRLMRQQFEEQAELGQTIIQTTIDSAVSTISYWVSQDLKNPTFARSLPSPETLMPPKADSAMDHAGRLNQEGAAKLCSAFDDLRTAFAEIENLRNLCIAYGTAIDVHDHAQRAITLLKLALAKFIEAKSILLKAAE